MQGISEIPHTASLRKLVKVESRDGLFEYVGSTWVSAEHFNEKVESSELSDLMTKLDVVLIPRGQSGTAVNLAVYQKVDDVSFTEVENEAIYSNS